MSASTIKAAIKANLDELVSSDVLAGASSSDFKKDPLAADIPGFPYAFLMPPSIESEASDNRSNIRVYTYDIMVLWNAENIDEPDVVEAGIEAILDVFDNDPTLSGTAMAGMLPVSSAPQPVQHSTRTLIMAIIQVQAKQFVSLTF